MPMTVPERARFWQRSADDYEDHRRQARRLGKVVCYSLDDFRTFAERRLDGGTCPYCRGPLGVPAFAVGLRVQPARRGKFTLRNLEVCCSDCHLLKSVLDGDEFAELVALVRGWPKPVAKHFLARLRAGAALVPARLPAPGSLEWFTGSDQPHAPFDVAARRYQPRPGTSEPGAPKEEAPHEMPDRETALGDPVGGGGDPLRRA